jgi:MATE family multidrug resistance protein
LRYGLPNGFQFLFDIAGFALFIFLVGRLGKVELAATNLAFNLNLLAFVPMLGLGTAVMTLVGKRVGEGRPKLAIRTTWLAFLWTGGYMVICAALYVLLPDAMIGLFLSRQEDADSIRLAPLIHAQAVVLLRFLAAFSFFDAMAVIFGSAIRGAGDTRFSLAFTTLTCWVLMVFPTALAVAWYADGLQAESLAAIAAEKLAEAAERPLAERVLLIAWWGCTIYIVVVGAGMMLRFRQGRWQSMRVIEAEPNLLATDLGPSVAAAADPPDASP